jgi:hypothetical protein
VSHGGRCAGAAAAPWVRAAVSGGGRGTGGGADGGHGHALQGDRGRAWDRHHHAPPLAESARLAQAAPGAAFGPGIRPRLEGRAGTLALAAGPADLRGRGRGGARARHRVAAVAEGDRAAHRSEPRAGLVLDAQARLATAAGAGALEAVRGVRPGRGSGGGGRSSRPAVCRVRPGRGAGALGRHAAVDGADRGAARHACGHGGALGEGECLGAAARTARGAAVARVLRIAASRARPAGSAQPRIRML